MFVFGLKMTHILNYALISARFLAASVCFKKCSSENVAIGLSIKVAAFKITIF
jgi:hypothetical protein